MSESIEKNKRKEMEVKKQFVQHYMSTTAITAGFGHA